MGMFDTFSVADEELCKGIKCAAGHLSSPSDEFQTKDLDNALFHFRIKNYKLQVLQWPVVESEEYKDTNYTGHVRFYRNCTHCRAIQYCRDTEEVSDPSKHDKMYPWLEYVAVFRNGELLFIDPVELETREQVVEQVEKWGIVLPDSNDKDTLLDSSEDKE